MNFVTIVIFYYKRQKQLYYSSKYHQYITNVCLFKANISYLINDYTLTQNTIYHPTARCQKYALFN